jgi:hypothetical protein
VALGDELIDLRCGQRAGRIGHDGSRFRVGRSEERQDGPPEAARWRIPEALYALRKTAKRNACIIMAGQIAALSDAVKAM